MQNVTPTNDGLLIFKLGKKVLRTNWQGEGVHQVQITALDPQPAAVQLELFAEPMPDHSGSNRVMDAINQRYGEFALTPARLLNRSSMPNVIAPAWKPFGHRKTV